MCASDRWFARWTAGAGVAATLCALVGCSDDPGAVAGDGPRPPPTGDTAAPPPPPPPCVDDSGPCSAELAAATWSGGAPFSWTGIELKAGTFQGTSAVMVGSPTDGPARAFVLHASDLALLGTWEDPNTGDSSLTSNFGLSIALPPDGGRIAISARSGGQQEGGGGLVYVLDRLPVGTESPEHARLELIGDLDHDLAGFGRGLAYLDVTGGGTELIVGTGNVDPDYPNAIFRFHPDLTGSHGVDSALASITGAPILGQSLAGWDADGDGLAELVSSADYGVVHFPAPWIGDLLESDADVVWSERHPDDQLADTIEVLDDLDGDGRADLMITANTYSATVLRGGAAYLIPAGPLQSVPATDLPYAFLGTVLGEGVGSAATSGDYDGDGAPDLVVGAYGVFPGELAGKVLGYLGPLVPGTRTAADADFVVHGEAVPDLFGAETVTVDADGDTRDDLVVSAQQWDGRGKVYLFLGEDLLP